MFAKLIICSVEDRKRAAFSNAQLSWAKAADSRGFIEQFGGWDANGGGAVILSKWNSKKSLSNFMLNSHDRIAIESKQCDTYQSCSISHLVLRSDIAGNPSESSQHPTILRITDCQVLPGKTHKFLTVQKTVWNTGMAKCKGMSGGHVWEHSEDLNRFFISTLWNSETDYANYTDNVLPTLKTEAKITTTIDAIQGYTVVLSRDWSC